MAQLFTWQKNILKAARTHNVVILHGNIRDLYLYSNPPHHYEIGFDELLTRLIFDKFGHILRYDPYSKVFDLHIGEADTFRADEVDGYGLEGFSGSIDSVITRILKDMEARAGKKTWMLKYMHNFLPYRSSYSPEEAMRLIAMQRMIENIRPENRLILSFISDSTVPIEFSQNSHRIAFIKIPMPDYAERQSFWTRYLARQDKVVERTKKTIEELAKLTDGLALTSLKTLVGMAEEELKGNDFSSMTLIQWNRIIGQYKFGETEDHYERITPEQLDKAEIFFAEQEGIKGQDEALKKTVKMLLKAKTNISPLLKGPSNAPRGVLFLCGPSGTGKTMLSKKLAKFVFGSEEAFHRFDMSEYQQDYTISKLIGSPPGYVGYEMGGLLTNAIMEKPFSVILFDEIEKAHPRIFDIFLQILSDGRLTDSRGQIVFFSESIIVFTSNIGTRVNEIEQLREAQQSSDRNMVREHFEKCVSSFFRYEISRPELLNRIGKNIVPFNFLDQENVLLDTVNFYLESFEKSFNEAYEKKNLSIRIEKENIGRHILEKYGREIREFGGRAIINVLDDILLPDVSGKILLYSQHPTPRKITLTVSVTIRKGEEAISVSP